ncbi:MAG: hypothetical protein KAR39_06185 [Thermoplasmata archaeon]|nr:hypothetical protein [Thermoplasmata archaeon]
MEMPIDWIFFLFEVVIVMIILYVATRIVCKEDIVSAAYALRLFVTALLAVVLVPMMQNILGLGIIGLLIAFFLLVLIIRYVIVSEASLGEEVIESILIALITLISIFIINYIAKELLDVTVLGGLLG